MGRWFDPRTGISDVGAFPSNMIGRNLFRGPGMWNMDLGLYKSFSIGEKYSLQFRAEGYNAFNHPNLQNPQNSAAGMTWDASSANYVTTGYSGRRFVQLALKLLF